MNQELNQPAPTGNFQFEVKSKETGRNEGSQTFWILKNRFIELFGSELVLYYLQDKERMTLKAIQRSLRLLPWSQKGEPSP